MAIEGGGEPRRGVSGRSSEKTVSGRRNQPISHMLLIGGMR